MNYPKQLKTRKKIDALTGIKSSLDHIRSVISLVYLFYIANGRKASVRYSIPEESKIKIAPELLNAIEEVLGRKDLEATINANPLITNQYEPLYVGVTLLMKLGYLKMEGRQNTAERTGGVRYPKQLYFANNILVLDLILQGFPENIWKQSLCEWLQNSKASNNDFEERVCKFITTCTFLTQFKLRDNNNNELFFQTEGIYKALTEGDEEVLYSDSHEFVGPTRIYNNVLKEGIEPWIGINKSVLNLKGNLNPDAESISQMLSTTLDIYNVKDDSLLIDEELEADDNLPNADNVFNVPLNTLNYLAAIKTKPFLILGGFSGTGKSQKVKELAFLTCPNDEEMRKKLGNTNNTPGNYCLVSVRPNWHDSTDLLGYYSSINDKYIVTDFVRFLVKAMQYPEIPFFVCLDEMNLAPVEEYFAEYLSVLESRKKVGKEIKTDPLVSCDWFKKDYEKFNIFDELGLLRVGRTQSTGENRQASMFGDTDDDAFDRLDIVAKLKKYGLCLPPNVVVIGTVNMDDTTNSFSRKVIDRAMTFETIVEEFDNGYYEAEDTMTYGGSNVGDWTWILPDEVRANEAIEHTPNILDADQKTEVTNFINEVNTCLKGSPFQIAYRILNETILYYRATKIVNKGEADLNKVFDDILMQKVLPRIEGDYDKTYKPLAALRTKAETKGWTKSKEKIDFMLGRFSQDDQGGFTSFWN
jgi:hypothetical protein